MYGLPFRLSVSHWDALFALCGVPSQLLRESLEAGEPQCAAAFLVPVRRAL